MKKIFTLLAFGFCAVLANAQAEDRSIVPQAAPTSALYFNDVIIQNTPAIDQRHVRLSVAFNGWLYAAYSTVDSVTNSGGITIRSSRDNGQTWSTIDAYSVPSVRYESLDIVVAGTDTNNLTLYLGGINHNTGSGTYILFVDRYNATTGAFSGSNYNLNAGTRTIYDVALASDYRFPAVGASPYSVGLLYSTYSSSYDSIVFLCSTDGGGTWGYRQTVATTGGYNRNISLAYGHGASASNGRYFAAWEQLGSSTARVGHIFTGHSVSTVDGAWTTKLNLDSLSSTMINVCRNPQIAVQFNNTDNDSGSITAAVVCERDYSVNGTDYDLLGFYSKTAHYANFWYRFDIVNTSENDLGPDISYDPTNNNFLVVYQDSTNGKLPYLVNGMNMATPSTWTTISAQYNDVTTNLKHAFPRVEINPVTTQTAHAWVAESGTKGVAMFDAEYVVAGVPNFGHGGMSLDQVYPNPASNAVNIVFSGSEEPVTVTIINVMGQLVNTFTATTANGQGSQQLDVSNWTAGTYFCRIDNGKNTVTRRFIVAH